MNVATQCDCCKEAVEGQSFYDKSCKNPVCRECAINLRAATELLNKQGMVNYFFGPCPDNGPEGLKNP